MPRSKSVETPGLFDQPSSVNPNTPLALRMTPRTISEWAGQEHILGEGKLLRRAVDADRLSSAIFFGPPGCGKSALARLIARQTKAKVESLNAVTAGVADVRAVIHNAKERRSLTGEKTLLVLDEIHRFNKAQQDALLPDVERGIITLIGLTTENPFFYVNSALLSRAQVFEFKPLTEEALNKVIDHALTDSERGLGKLDIQLDPDARLHFITQANGDARRLLNALELAALTTPTTPSPVAKMGEGPDTLYPLPRSAGEGRGIIHITLKVAEECVQKRSMVYDKSGDQHYDIASAFIKSLRGGRSRCRALLDGPHVAIRG